MTSEDDNHHSEMPFGVRRYDSPSEVKYKSKFQQNPSVPIGLGLAAGVLTYGIYNLRQNRHLPMIPYAMKIFQLRVITQGALVLSIFVGCVTTYVTVRRREAAILQAESDAKKE